MDRMAAVRSHSEAGDKPQLFLRRTGQLEAKAISGTEGGINPFLSPDDRWVGFWADGKFTKVSIDGGRYPLWGSKGSGELFYVDLNGGMMAASVALSPGLSLGRVTKLFDGEKPPRGTSGRPYDISPIDGRFLMTKPATDASSGAINISVVLNWFEALRERVPRGAR